MKFSLRTTSAGCLNYNDSKLGILLSRAVMHYRYEIVKLFLEDGRFDPTSDFHFAFKSAIHNRDLKLLQLFVEDGRVDLTVDKCYALRMSVALDSPAVIEYLLSFDEVLKYAFSYKRDIFSDLVVYISKQLDISVNEVWNMYNVM